MTRGVCQGTRARNARTQRRFGDNVCSATPTSVGACVTCDPRCFGMSVSTRGKAASAGDHVPRVTSCFGREARAMWSTSAACEPGNRSTAEVEDGGLPQSDPR